MGLGSGATHQQPRRPTAQGIGLRQHDPLRDDDLHKFSVGQYAATTAAFKLAGYEGELLVAPITGEDERAFLLALADFRALRDRVALEQVLTQLLGRKVWVAERTSQWGEPVPFE